MKTAAHADFPLAREVALAGPRARLAPSGGEWRFAGLSRVFPASAAVRAAQMLALRLRLVDAGWTRAASVPPEGKNTE